MATIVSILGGVGLFLLGMAVMTDGLKALAGSALRGVLAKAAATPLRGTFWGAVITLLVQSSSATTMTTIGLVSAGLLTFPQGLSLVFGANIGTTGTGWLVALLGVRISLTAAALPIVFVGALLKLVGRGRWAGAGSAIAGFALILVGLTTLQQGMGGLAEQLDPGGPAQRHRRGRCAMVVGNFGRPSVGAGWDRDDDGHAIFHSGNCRYAICFVCRCGWAGSGCGAGHRSEHRHSDQFGDGSSGCKQHSEAVGCGVYCVQTDCRRGRRYYFSFRSFELMVRAVDSADAVTLLAIYHTGYNIVGVAILLPLIVPFTKMIERFVPERGNPLTRMS